MIRLTLLIVPYLILLSCTPPPKKTTWPCPSMSEQKYNDCLCHPNVAMAINILNSTGLPDNIRTKIGKCLESNNEINANILGKDIAKVKANLSECVRTEIELDPNISKVLGDIAKTIVDRPPSQEEICNWLHCVYGASAICPSQPPPSPRITSFSPINGQIVAGQSTVLKWSVLNADKVVIDNVIGSRGNNDSAIVSPIVTTVYMLVASNSSGQDTAWATINVGPDPISIEKKRLDDLYNTTVSIVSPHIVWMWGKDEDRNNGPSNGDDENFIVCPNVHRGNTSSRFCVWNAVQSLQNHDTTCALGWLKAGQAHNGGVQSLFSQYSYAALRFTMETYGSRAP